MPVLDAVDYYLQQRLALTDATSLGLQVQRKGNVDVFNATLLENSNGAGGDVVNEYDQQEIGLCHFYVALPFSDGTDIFTDFGTYEGAAAIALAVQHLNTRNGSLIGEIATEMAATNCKLRFSVEMEDTELQESAAVDHVIEATDPNSLPSSHLLPCAVLGAVRSAVSIPTSIITGLRGYPQISALSTSVALDDKSQYPLFGRTIPADDGTAVPVIKYIRSVLGVRYLCILNVNDAYGNAYAMGLSVAAQQFAPDLQIQQFDISNNADEKEIERAVQLLVSTEYTYFFGILFPTLLDPVMREAYRQGIAGTGRHNWIFSDAAGTAVISRPFPTDSALQKAFQGTGIITASAGLQGFNSRLDGLTEQLQSIKENSQDLNFLESLFPKVQHADGSVLEFDIQNESFLSTPGIQGGFLYDATVALGLSACQAWHEADGEGQRQTLEGHRHFETMLTRAPFAGTSGMLKFNHNTGTRDPTTAFFTLTNHVVDMQETSSTDVQYKQVLSGVFRDGQWEQLTQYVFNDGTTEIPPDLPPITRFQDNHLSGPLRILGLAMCGICICMALSFATWTCINRNTHVVKASQPIFLLILCAGVCIFVSTIIPLSFDDGVASVSACNVACVTIPWLLSIGFSAIFSALFTKTRRINKIFHNPSFHRIRVTAMDVIMPMFVLQGLNVVLLTAWTLLSPLSWTFEVVETDSFGRPTEVLGYCSSNNLFPFFIPVVVLNLSALVFAVHQAYVARRVSTEFSESEYIFKVMLTILMVCFIGIPVLILAQENPDAFFFVFTGILFVSSCSILLLIFVPKMRYLEETQQKWEGPRVSVTGLTLPFESQTGRNELENIFESDELNDLESDDGIAVLSTKTQAQLIEENSQLRRRLRAALATSLASGQESFDNESNGAIDDASANTNGTPSLEVRQVPSLGQRGYLASVTDPNSLDQSNDRSAALTVTSTKHSERDDENETEDCSTL